MEDDVSGVGEPAYPFDRPIRSMPIQRAGGERPQAKDLKQYAEKIRIANVMCFRARRTFVAVVLYGDQVTTTEGVLEPLGADFWADCRCATSHAIDGDLLHRAVLDLPERRRRDRAPTIDVRLVERRSIS